MNDSVLPRFQIGMLCPICTDKRVIASLDYEACTWSCSKDPYSEADTTHAEMDLPGTFIAPHPVWFEEADGMRWASKVDVEDLTGNTLYAHERDADPKSRVICAKYDYTGEDIDDVPLYRRDPKQTIAESLGLEEVGPGTFRRIK